MEHVLVRAQEQVECWERSRDKAVRHLSSLANLTEQLDTLHYCVNRPSKLGVLSQHSSAILTLEGKLMEAMERAMAAVARERCVCVSGRGVCVCACMCGCDGGSPVDL